MTLRKRDKSNAERRLGLPKLRVGGRFISAYSPEIGLKVCERIAEGDTLKDICTIANGMCSRQTFHRWVVIYPELSRAYAAARELSAHALEEEALTMARAISVDKKASSVHVRSFEVAMNQLRWSASRRNPRVYSERGSVQITVPIQINTALDLGDGPAQSSAEHPNIYTLDASMVQEVEPQDSLEAMQLETKPLVTKNPSGTPLLHSTGEYRRRKMAEAREKHRDDPTSTT